VLTAVVVFLLSQPVTDPGGRRILDRYQLRGTPHGVAIPAPRQR
jgi:hypothetical protein